MISSFFILFLFCATGMAKYPYLPPNPSPRCGANEVLKECPAHCQFENTCSSLLDYNSNPCPNGRSPSYRCEPRCECREGFARINGQCQPAQNCCSKPNQELVDYSSTCEETCESNSRKDCESIYRSKKKCRCKKGYVRDHLGNCISKKTCPKCNTNEEYKFCGSSCSEKCDSNNPICPLICGSGCFCKNGFQRDNNGVCIDANQCIHSKCSVLAHEKYSDCINPCPQNTYCTSPCIAGCVCENGYVRVRGTCVKETPQCRGENESFQKCHGGCDPTCNLTNINCKSCRDGCFCNPGFVRHNGKCIRKESCARTTTMRPYTTTTVKVTPYCRRFEVYYDCLPEREPTCRDPKGHAAYNCKSGCTCKPGFVRDNGECKPLEQCFQGYFY